MNGHSNFIHNTSKLEITHGSSSRWKTGIVIQWNITQHKEEWITDTHNSMGETLKYYAEWRILTQKNINFMTLFT